MDEGLGGAMMRRVVGGCLVPAAPEDTHPSSGEDADGVRMVAASAAGSSVDLLCPGGEVSGVVGEAGQCLAQSLVAGVAEADTAVFARLIGDGSDAGFGGKLIVGSKALRVVAELGKDLGGVDLAGPRGRT